MSGAFPNPEKSRSQPGRKVLMDSRGKGLADAARPRAGATRSLGAREGRQCFHASVLTFPFSPRTTLAAMAEAGSISRHAAARGGGLAPWGFHVQATGRGLRLGAHLV